MNILYKKLKSITSRSCASERQNRRVATQIWTCTIGATESYIVLSDGYSGSAMVPLTWQQLLLRSMSLKLKLTVTRGHSQLLSDVWADMTSSYVKRGKVSVRTFVRNAGRGQHGYYKSSNHDGQLSSEWRHNENDVIMRTGAARDDETRKWRHNENNVMMIISGRCQLSSSWRYGDWRHVATDCNALAFIILNFVVFSCSIGLH